MKCSECNTHKDNYRSSNRNKELFWTEVAKVNDGKAENSNGIKD